MGSPVRVPTIYFKRKIPKIGDTIEGKKVSDVWFTKYWNHCFVLFEDGDVGLVRYQYNYKGDDYTEMMIAFFPCVPKKKQMYGVWGSYLEMGMSKFYGFAIRMASLKPIWKGRLYEGTSTGHTKVILCIV